MNLSQHARKRVRQRGYREDDVDLIAEIATETPDGLFLTDADVRRECERLNQAKVWIQRRIQRLERIKGTLVPADGETALSIYRPGHCKSRRILRARRGRGVK
jgi:hypothetical protein